MGCGEGCLGRGLCLFPENFGTFSLEMARFGANSVVYFNRIIRLFTARTTIFLAVDGEVSGEVSSRYLEMAHFGALSFVF